MVFEYHWKNGRCKGNAQKVGERIAAMGKPTAREVLEDGRKKTSPLHECFEWNDGVAAEKYRLDQARGILMELVITVPKKKGNETVNLEYRAYENIRQDDNAEGFYINTLEMLQTPEYAEIAFANARAIIEEQSEKLERFKDWMEDHDGFQMGVKTVIKALRVNREKLPAVV